MIKYIYSIYSKKKQKQKKTKLKRAEVGRGRKEEEREIQLNLHLALVVFVLVPKKEKKNKRFSKNMYFRILYVSYLCCTQFDFLCFCCVLFAFRIRRRRKEGRRKERR